MVAESIVAWYVTFANNILASTSFLMIWLLPDTYQVKNDVSWSYLNIILLAMAFNDNYLMYKAADNIAMAPLILLHKR